MSDPPRHDDEEEVPSRDLRMDVTGGVRWLSRIAEERQLGGDDQPPASPSGSRGKTGPPTPSPPSSS